MTQPLSSSPITPLPRVTSAPDEDGNYTSSAESTTSEDSSSLFVERLTYQIIVVQEHLALQDRRVSYDPENVTENAEFVAPTMHIDRNIQELRLYLPPDVLAIPVDVISNIILTASADFKPLQRVKIFIQSLARPYITDILDTADICEKFMSMLSLSEAYHVNLEILFRTLESESASADSIDPRCFRMVDTKTLYDAIYALSWSEHTSEITQILGEESRIQEMAVRSSAEGHQGHMCTHIAEVEDDEML